MDSNTAANRRSIAVAHPCSAYAPQPVRDPMERFPLTLDSYNDSVESCNNQRRRRVMRVHIETHGCKLNTADSQRMAREFVSAGYELTGADSGADVFVLNSCTVTHVADRKARQSLSVARRRFPGAVIVASGCYAQRAAHEITTAGIADLVVTNVDKPDIVGRVTERLGERFSPCAIGALGPPVNFLLGRSRASVKIQEGCDQVCAYCIVPKVRGRERSIPEQSLVDQVNELHAAGWSEVILTGTQLGSYGFDLPGTSLTGMLSRIIDETGMPRIRVSSLQPLELTDELLELWTGAGQGRLCPHFHLPLQSGSDDVLARMRRRHDSVAFIKTVERVRAAVPDCSITTDVIAGFPGETDDDHSRTISVIERVAFADAHVFPYSSRPGTSAAHLDGQVDGGVRAGRAAQIREITEAHAIQHRMRFIGVSRPVLWEGDSRSSGLTDNYLRVKLDSTISRVGLPPLSGDGVIEDILLTDMDGTALVGRPLSVAGDVFWR